jgi:hypothetical protein
METSASFEARFQGPRAVPLASCGPVLDWSLSPDGQRIALIDHKDHERVQLLALGNHTARALDLGKWSHVSAQLQFVRWFSNGRGLYVTVFLPSGTTLLSVGLDGNASVLSQGPNWLCRPIPSPNGKLLGYSLTEITRDAAMIEFLIPARLAMSSIYRARNQCPSVILRRP